MRSKPIKIAITGGIASGKTAIANAFKNLGFFVISADNQIDEIYRSQKDGVRKELPSLPHNFTKDDARAFAFSSAQNLKMLEKAMLKLYRKSLKNTISHSKKNVIFVEVPTLFENTMEYDYDFIILMHAPQYLRRRLFLKRGRSIREFNIFNRKQFHWQRKIYKSDFVINVVSPIALKNEALKIVKILDINPKH